LVKKSLSEDVNLTREEVAETVEDTIEIDAQVIVEAVMGIEEEMTVAVEITGVTEMTVVAETTEAIETIEVAETTEVTGIEAVEAEVQIVTEAEALMIEEVVQIDQGIAIQVKVEVATDTAQEVLEALIEEEVVKAVVDLDKSAEEEIIVENLEALDKAGIEILTEVAKLQNHHGRRTNQHSRKSLLKHSGRLRARKAVMHIILVLKKSNQRSTKRGNEHGC